jgi:hypothetical protein
MVSLFRGPNNQFYDVLNLLFELGADANIGDQNGLNMLHVLGFTQNGEARDPVIIERLVTQKRGNTPLNQMAINLRQVEPLRALLRCNASLKVKNLKGDMLLHQAAHGRVICYKDGTGIELHGVPLDATIKGTRRYDGSLKRSQDWARLDERKEWRRQDTTAAS